MSVRPVVLALRASGIGDLLTAVPALRALRRAWPDSTVVLATRPTLAPLALATGAIDEVLPTDGLGHRLACPGPIAVAVDLHGRGPESHRRLLESGPERLIAFEHRSIPASRGMPVWRAREHDMQRWCRLLDESGVPADLLDHRLSLDRVDPPIVVGTPVVLHVGAGSPSRRWPRDRWLEVARRLHREGAELVLTGDAVDRADALAIARAVGIPDSAVVAGRTDVLMLATVVADASLVVCGDTGVGHLATALDVPSVHLFGPVSPSEWGPPVESDRHVVLWAGRRGDPHGDRLDPGLALLRADDVVAVATRLLAAHPTARRSSLPART